MVAGLVKYLQVRETAARTSAFLSFRYYQLTLCTLIAELAESSPIIIQNSSAEKIWMYGRTTVRPTVQGATFSIRGQLYHGHYLIISPLHGHGEVANESPLILPGTLSIVGALVLLKRRAGKKCELRF